MSAHVNPAEIRVWYHGPLPDSEGERLHWTEIHIKNNTIEVKVDEYSDSNYAGYTVTDDWSQFELEIP